MSDPPRSDIDFKYKMPMVWTTFEGFNEILFEFLKEENKEESKVQTKQEIDDREQQENDSIQSDEQQNEPASEPSNQPGFKTRDDSPEPESAELKESKMSEVVGQFSTSKWKPVEKSDSNNSSEPVKKESSDLSHVRIHSFFTNQS